MGSGGTAWKRQGGPPPPPAQLAPAAPGPAPAAPTDGWSSPVPPGTGVTGLGWDGDGGGTGGNRNDRAVGALLGLLLCLAVGLALAWHHLCRLSAGRYHPRPMGRRALELLRGRWHRLRGQGDTGPQSCQGDGEVAAPQEEEELMPWSQEQRLEEKEEEEEREEEEEEEEEAEAAPQGGESPPQGGEPAAGGSAEVLLSDLHAFSGTAGWGEARPHVTAL
ncbi:protein tyrosine phosphatase receptor type C-associated protein [Chroicocephalus ridibundus]|uniref:protein tyrosine phosphatase receptor type C-associated protein n=1 Tax=Chroicocephalus ridibundus TaxID=1192867 RepID=UPI002FDEC05B